MQTLRACSGNTESRQHGVTGNNPLPPAVDIDLILAPNKLARSIWQHCFDFMATRTSHAAQKWMTYMMMGHTMSITLDPRQTPNETAYVHCACREKNKKTHLPGTAGPACDVGKQ